MRAAPDCRPPPTARHALQPRSSSTSHPPQQQDAVHRELRPGTGKGARAGAGPLRRATRPAAGPARAPPPPPTAPPPQPLTTRSLPTTTGRRKGGHPVVSNRPLHRAMQQRCHHASASARSPSWPPMPRPRLQRAATARREKVQLRIREQSFYLHPNAWVPCEDTLRQHAVKKVRYHAPVLHARKICAQARFTCRIGTQTHTRTHTCLYSVI